MKDTMEPQFTSMETHVEIAVYDPFPTTIKRSYDGCNLEEVIPQIIAEFTRDLIGVVVYDVSVITLNGILYRSQPLNRRRFTLTAGGELADA